MAVPASENYQLFFPADAHQQSGRPGAEVEILASSDDFFGGYDHDRKAGVVQIVDHQISPVKARHTLSRTDLELITPVYARSQQDASFFAPYETRTFSQFWYPIQKIGQV